MVILVNADHKHYLSNFVYVFLPHSLSVSLIEGFSPSFFSAVVVTCCLRNTSTLQKTPHVLSWLRLWKQPGESHHRTLCSLVSTLSLLTRLLCRFQTWSSIRNTISEDFTFATGLTPFGPFGVSLGLSFVLKDASARALLLQYKNQTISELREFLNRFQTIGTEVRDVFSQDDLHSLHYQWKGFMEQYQKGDGTFFPQRPAIASTLSDDDPD